MENQLKNREDGKGKKQEATDCMKAQWRMMEVWTLPLHQAEQDLFWIPGDHGRLDVTDFTGTRLVSSAGK